jgi:hypothetical protein
VAGTSLALPQAQQAVLKYFERTLKRSADVVEAAQMAPDLEVVTDPVTLESRMVGPDGMTARQLRIAQHALLPAKAAPLYLTEAYRDFELAQKLAAAAQGGAGTQTARTVVLVVEKPVYERVRVDRGDAIEVEATKGSEHE